MSDAEHEQATATQPSKASTSSSSSRHDGQSDAAKTSNGKEGERATADQPATALSMALVPRVERESYVVPREDQRASVDQPLPVPTSSLSSHDGQPDTTQTSSSKERRAGLLPNSLRTLWRRRSCLTNINGTSLASRRPLRYSRRTAVRRTPRERFSRKESEPTIADKPVTTLTSLPPCEGQQESTKVPSDEDQRAVVDQPLPASRFLPSSYDSQPDTAQTSSGKESERDTAKQPMTALTTSLPSCEDRHGRHREAVKTAAACGTEDERSATRNASVKPAFDRTSSLSPTEGHQEAAQTSTVAALMTAVSVAPAAPMSPLDHVLICGHGRFQQITLVCTALAFFTTIVHAVASANLARPVDHWCRPTVQYSYMEPDAWWNISIPVVREEDGTERRSQCERFEPPLPYAESSAALPDNRTIVPCDAGWQYASGASSGSQRCNIIFAQSHGHSIVDEWDLVCGRSWMVPALAAVYVVGGVVGAPLAGIAADRIGRRPVLGIWLMLLVFAGTAIVFANSVPLFAALRFVTSAGTAGVLVASQVLLFEVTDSQHRVLYCAIAVAAAAFVAALYTELVYDFIRNWHAAQVVYMVPTCGLIFAAYLVEESPCWLLAIYELRNAEHVLSRAAGANRVEPQVFRRRPVGAQGRDEQAALSLDGVRLSDLLSNQLLRQRSAIIFGCWFLAFGTFAHLSTSHVLRDNQGARAALVVLRLPCVVADVYVLTRNSRRLCLAFSMLALAIATGALSLAVAFGAADQVAAVLVVSALLIFDMSAISAFVLSAELYPTVLRGAAFGCCYMSGRLGALAALFVNEIQSLPLRGTAYAVAAAMLLLFGTMALALPETKHMPPSNTVHGMMVVEDKWQLYSPLRVARARHKRRTFQDGAAGERPHAPSQFFFAARAGYLANRSSIRSFTV
ncbi:hypothetical protein MTO96_005500 [Rhipicephalus appendiculatus]